MEERLGRKLDDLKKEQLLGRIKEAIDQDILDVEDWLKIYQIMLEASAREARRVYEECVMASLEEGSDEE